MTTLLPVAHRPKQGATRVQLVLVDRVGHAYSVGPPFSPIRSAPLPFRARAPRHVRVGVAGPEEHGVSRSEPGNSARPGGPIMRPQAQHRDPSRVAGPSTPGCRRPGRSR